VEALVFDPQQLKIWDQGLENYPMEQSGPPLLRVKDFDFSYPQDMSKQPVLEGSPLP
jgi:hypothetical protein